MRALVTREQARQVDLDAVARLGLPSVVLMENAGRGAADALLRHFPRPGLVTLLGGPGQNGGDAWVVARQLRCRGVAVRCGLVGPRDKVSGDALTNLQALSALGVSVQPVGGASELPALLEGASVVVDGLFGTGLDRPIEGRFAEVIDALSRSAVPVVALDLPSGIDANTGGVLGVCAPAALTVTFAALKRGLFQYPGAGHAGTVEWVGIGVPEPDDAPARLIETSDLSCLAGRPADAHKGKAGHVLVVAGGPGKTGAALLAARGALRAGAGLVTLAPRPEAYPQLAGRVLEEMTFQVPDEDGVEALVAFAEDKASALLGPGLGLDEAGLALSRQLARRLPVPCVLDADALTAHAGDLESLRQAAAPRVLTPHPGEAARVLGVSTAEVQADRFAAAEQLAVRSGQVAVLKGAGSLVATPDGQVWVCDRGTPALAVAGTGDVLCGVIAAQLAQAPPLEAARAGVWLHARSGELRARADRGLLASEVADGLPDALRAVQRERGAAG